MSEQTQCLASPYEFTHKDKTYKVSPINQKIKAEFEQKQFDRAIQVAKGLKPILTTDEFLAHIESISDNFRMGVFSFDNLMKSSKALTMMMALCFNIDEQEIYKLIVEAKEELNSFFKVVVEESYGIDSKQVKTTHA